jgi:hypothetical protein
MRVPLGPLLAILLVGATLFALLYDLARVGGHALQPWFGWMLP